MAVYSSLLLNHGGGVVDALRQIEPVQDEINLLIGIGGIGIDTIRTIKTEVCSRFKPDSIVDGEPVYDRIRFLGIDCDIHVAGFNNDPIALRALAKSEFLSLYNSHLRNIYGNSHVLKERKDASWLRWENISCDTFSRQVGRFLFIDNSQVFVCHMEKLIAETRAASKDSTINVHIFTDLCGQTSSGFFLDVCYLIRSLEKDKGPVNIFGYFFMPDVNISVIPSSELRYRQRLIEHGYAALQELDYCMHLPDNKGSFTQIYQNNKAVEWCEPPVDMCHLVCSISSDGCVFDNAYRYTVNITANYVVESFLTFPHYTSKLAILPAVLNTKKNNTNAAKKCVDYYSIGASCASIPLREINTYLASELFGKFSCICQNVPGKADVENLAISALARDAQSIADIYSSLEREMRDGFDDSYSAYVDDWKFVRDYGNSQMVTSYTNQTAAKLNIAEKNAKSMISAGNQKSLIGRVDTQLRNLIRSINYGPMFAYGLVSAAKSHNLLNIIDGLIQENTSRWDQEAAQTSLRREDYDNAKADFDNRRKRNLFDNDAKRFGDYEYYLMLFEQHKLAMKCYAKLDEVLTVFRKQIEELTAAYYIKLNRVFDTLINTFKENRDALASEKIMQAKGSFSIPMMTIAELKPTLDAEIEQINVPGMLDAFMRLFLDNEETWISEDENKIAKLVNEFFVKTAFGGFANRTITAFLKDKYAITNDAQLANKIYNEWMKMLTTKASPLFYFNSGVWREDQTAKLAFLSIPDSSAPIQAAADQMFATNNMWQKWESIITDRIAAVCLIGGVPISAYKFCEEFEQICLNSVTLGRYVYEGKDISGMEFNDWCKLPLLFNQNHKIGDCVCPP